MTRPPDEYGHRKQVLVARGALLRLRLRHGAHRLGESFTFGRVGATVARSPAARSAAFLLAVELVGPDRIARLLSFASQVLAVARMGRAAFAWMKEPADRPAGPPSP